MTTKKMNSAPGPDLDSIISSLTPPEKKIPSHEESAYENTSAKEPPENAEAETVSDDHEGRLWPEFLEILRDSEEDSEESRTTKLYAIDDDIVETLHQCDFDGKPNVDVINSILRAFLIDNIERLRQMQRPKSVSLLDKY